MRPQGLAEAAIFLLQRAGIVQFVGRDDELDVRRGHGHVGQMGLFSLAPGRFDQLAGVAAGDHDVGHSIAELAADFFPDRRAP